MIGQDPRWQQLRAAFAAELEERVRALNDLLVQLERGADGDAVDGELLDTLFREAHGLKGAARAVELAPVEQLAHGVESALDALRQSGARPTDGWFDALYPAVDMMERAARSDGVPASELEGMLGRLEAARVGGGNVAAARNPESIPRDAGQARRAVPEAEPSRSAPVAASPPPAPPAAPPTPPASRQNGHADSAARDSGRPAAESVRVAVEKLDGLLSQTGELAITQTRIEQRLHEIRGLRDDLAGWRREWRQERLRRADVRRLAAIGDTALAQELESLLQFVERAEQQTQAVLGRVEALTAQFRQDSAQLGLVSRRIEDEVLGVRLLPVTTIFGSFERMVRDLTRETGKEARLVLGGADTEVDRKILEQLRDPLMHMLRNAVDHGIERPDERQARGKPRQGTIQVRAAQRGGVVEIDVRDDGVGLDPTHLRASAVRKGLVTEEQAAALNDAAALELIFRPGFSTRTAVTEISGRGVGMDVVRAHLERLNGLIEVSSVPGQGTHIALRVPLTLATSRVLLVRVGEQRFAVPSASIERTGRVRPSDVVSLEGRRIVTIGGHAVPAADLARLLDRPSADPDARAADTWRPFLVLRQAERRLALLVDRLDGEQGIVVKSLGWPLRRVRNVAGATVLGTGEIVVILNPTDVLRTAARVQQTAAPVAATTPIVRRKQRLLVVDDSLTTRGLLGSILESAGYDVDVAMDGEEALSALRGHPDPPFDLVVTDVEMPRLDGFRLTAEIRRDEHLRETPVILVTSLASPEHRERGVAVGADAYIVKSGFDQSHLLETIRRLI